ncbi:MAG: hypothetical protein P8I85_05595, partial [Flavobacteriaceae bacterium]|nr:hypothetical protein [Flavobacteriaceae bacterium]
IHISEYNKLEKTTFFSKKKFKKYNYYFLNLKKNAPHKIDLNFFSIYVISCNNSFLSLNKDKLKLEKECCINFYNCKKTYIQSNKSNIQLLIAGKKVNSKLKPRIEKIKKNKLYKVVKPWGFENWLNGDGKYYSFKKIVLNSGFKTSLQFHKIKEETIGLFKGKAKLVYKNNSKINNLKVKGKDLREKTIKPFTILNVNQNVLHRLKAISNLTLFETSTPHLKDVIRVLDDLKRPDGLIKSEHKIS